MFQGLRAGTPIYVLHKNEPRLEYGEVVNVSNPMLMNASYNDGTWTPAQAVVDVEIQVGESTIMLRQLPANKSITDYMGKVVSESRDAILYEIENMRKNSIRAIEDVERHKQIVEACTNFISELNPQIKQDEARNKEMQEMRNEMAQLREMLALALSSKTEKPKKTEKE